MPEESANAPTIRELYAQVLGPGRMEDLFTLRDGLIVRWEVLEDPGAALQAVGLEE